MNMEQFTERSRGFIQAAQTIAMRESHQKLAPEHLLKALMDDEQGLATNLIAASGGEPKRVVQVLDTKLAKIPKVSGDAGQVYLDSATGRQVMGVLKRLNDQGHMIILVTHDKDTAAYAKRVIELKDGRMM